MLQASLGIVLTVGALWGTGNAPKSDRGSESRIPSASRDSCSLCHDLPSHTTHPLATLPRALDPGLPLDGSRQMTCVTCHTEDVETFEHAVEAPVGPRLRKEVPDLCASCHLPGERGSHALYLRRAHFSASMVGAPQVTPSSRAGDEETRLCLSCHDEGPSRVGQPDRPPVWLSVNLDRDHPLGVAYEQSRPAGQRVTLHPKDALPDEVRLFNGNLGCGSCHTPFSTLPDRLSLSNRGSRLCFACHDK